MSLEHVYGTMHPVSQENFWLPDMFLDSHGDDDACELQREVRRRLKLLQIPPLQPGKWPTNLPKSFQPLTREAADGTSWDYGHSAFRQALDDHTEEVREDADTEIDGTTRLATKADLVSVLKDALAVAEDPQQSILCRLTAERLVHSLVSLFQLGGYQTNDPRLLMAYLAGYLASRLEAESNQHFTLAGKRLIKERKKAARHPRKAGQWASRCEQYWQIKQELEQDYQPVTKADVCIKIAEAEIRKEEENRPNKRSPQELLEATISRKKTIAESIEEKLKQHALKK